MSKVSLRAAHIDDATILCAAEKKIAETPGFLASKPEELILENFIQKIENLTSISNGQYVVAEKNGQIVGHALLDPMRLSSIRHVVRLTIAVHPGNEEVGIGEFLLEHLIEWARDAKEVQKIELNVRSRNFRAIRLYQKLGFSIEGRIRHRVRVQEHFEDDLEMGLFVKDPEPVPSVVSLAIGRVVSTRRDPTDDNWDAVASYIELDGNQFSADSLTGLTSFSHAEIIFFMDQVDVRKIELAARHPRNNESWPKVGIFSQRGKNRPNQIAVTICKILSVDGLRIYLEGLDAIDGSPVIDIKPWVKEFGPRGPLEQPIWMSDLMKNYWR